MKPNILKLVADGFYREALAVYSKQNSASKRRHRFTFPPILKACGKLGLASHAKSLHTHLLKTGFLSDHYSATALIGMYASLRLLGDALKVFDEMPDRSLPSVNAVVSGLAQNGHIREALSVFERESYGGFRPNSVTVASFVSSSGHQSVGFAKMIHCWAVKLGVDKDVFVATAVMSAYSMTAEEAVSDSSRVFEEMSDKNLVSYNAHVSALLQRRQPLEVLNVFKEMMRSFDRKPNSVTLVSAISACTSLSRIELGRQVQGLALKLGLALDVMVGTTLVHMYSKSGSWRRACEAFEELGNARNAATWNAVISGMMSNGKIGRAMAFFEQMRTEGIVEPDFTIWNSMVVGLTRLGKGTEACKWFKKMQSVGGVSPDVKSMTSVLSACSDITALRSGKEIHGHATRSLVASDELLATALIDLYMKCGLSAWASKLFNSFVTKPKDPAIWNAMISGFGRNGEYESAFETFDQMLSEKVRPNDGTFMSTLSTCSHTGQVDKGLEIFQSMSTKFGLKPKSGHIGCMVDLLARCGRLSEARELVQKLPEPSVSVFASLLGACRSNLDSELGEEMANKLIELDPKNPMPYVVLSNIYAEQNRWRDVERIRKTICYKGYKKVPGFSLIEVVE